MDTKNPSLWVVSVLVAAVVLLWAAYGRVVPCFFTGPTSVGGFGDMYGGLNTLFAGLAFAGLIYAIVLQSRQLAVQRKELTETREEMKLAREEAKRTAQAQEDLARLSALTSLLEVYSTRFEKFYALAFERVSDSAADDGFREEVVRPRFKGIALDAQEGMHRCVEEVEKIYERIAGQSPDAPPKEDDQ